MKSIFTSLLVVCCASLVFSPSLVAFDAKSLVRDTLEKHREATQYEDWKKSEYHPTHLLEQLTPSMISEACEEILKLSSPEQTIFYTLIYPIRGDSTSCGRVIKNIRQFMKLKSQILLQAVRDREEEQRPRETQIQIINPQNGGFYVDADLEEGFLNFSFDDGPASSTTPELLSILDQYNLKVNFFVVGLRVQENPQIVQLAESQGHFMGNHSWDHINLSQVSSRSALRNIQKTFDLLDPLLEFPNSFFRFPYGAANRTLRRKISDRDIPEFFWRIDTLDWKFTDPEVLYEYALEEILQHGKGIVLFHDIQPQTIAIFPALIERLNQLGFQYVQLREMTHE